MGSFREQCGKLVFREVVVPKTRTPTPLHDFLQDIAYAYRVWITLNKPLYALLQYLKIEPDIH